MNQYEVTITFKEHKSGSFTDQKTQRDVVYDYVLLVGVGVDGLPVVCKFKQTSEGIFEVGKKIAFGFDLENYRAERVGGSTVHTFKNAVFPLKEK